MAEGFRQNFHSIFIEHLLCVYYMFEVQRWVCLDSCCHICQGSFGISILLSVGHYFSKVSKSHSRSEFTSFTRVLVPVLVKSNVLRNWFKVNELLFIHLRLQPFLSGTSNPSLWITAVGFILEVVLMHSLLLPLSDH